MTEPEPFDDPSIKNDDDLYRRIPPSQIEDGDVPSTAAFQSLDLSVNVARLTTPQQTMTPVSSRPDYLHWRLASFLADVPRRAGLPVYMSPLRDNPAHAIVWGRKKLAIQRRLAQACKWVDWTTGREG